MIGDNIAKTISGAGRVVSEVIGEANTQVAKDYVISSVISTEKWAHENLNPGEREIAIDVLASIAGIALGKVVNITTSGVKGKFTLNKEAFVQIEAQIAKYEAGTSHNFMGVVGGKASILKTQHTQSIENHLKNLIKHGTIELAPDLSVEHQIDYLTKFYQKQFLKYHNNLNNVAKNEWKMKVVGNAQHTGTSGHARACAQLAIEHAKNPEVEFVFMNQGLKKISGAELIRNTRPDVTIVYKDGKINMIEVMSKTDREIDLEKRLENAIEALPKSIQGKKEVLSVKDALEQTKKK